MDAEVSPPVQSAAYWGREVWDGMIRLFQSAISSGDEDRQLYVTQTARRIRNIAPDSIIKRTISILVRLIESTFPRVQESVVSCLNMFARFNGGSLRAYIGEAEGVAALLRLLQRSPPSEHQKIFSKLLTNLLVSERQNRVIFQRIHGVEAIMNLFLLSSEENKGFVVEILTAAILLKDARRELESCRGVFFLIRALSCGSMASRARAAGVIELMESSGVRHLLVPSGAMPPLLFLMKTGDQETKLIAADALGSISSCTEYVRWLADAGAIRMFAELLEEEDDRGKRIAVDVFCNWSVEDESCRLICDQMVRILRGNNELAKFAAIVVLTEVAEHERFFPILQITGVISTLLDLVREGGEDVGSKALGLLAEMSHLQEGRYALDYQGAIPVLTDLLGSASEVFKDHAATALVSFAEDSLLRNRISHLLDDENFQTLRREHLAMRARARAVREQVVCHFPADSVVHSFFRY